MLTIMVTGVNGFVGKHLARELNALGHKIVGVSLSGVDSEIKPILLRYENCDLANHEQVSKLRLDDIDGVINLAGLAKPKDSFGADESYIETNVNILSFLGKRLIEAGTKARMIAISTGLVYDTSQPMPLTESSKTISVGSPYALSKLSMEQAANQLRSAGLDCVIARPFNHSGPGQTPGFLIPDLYKKLQAFKQTGKPVPVSPKLTKRDYTDVRDVVKAYVALVSAKELDYEFYNICSGQSRSAVEIMKLMQAVLGINDVATEVDQSLSRPNDPEDLFGSYTRLHNEVDWRPVIPFEQTISDFVVSAVA